MLVVEHFLRRVDADQGAVLQTWSRRPDTRVKVAQFLSDDRLLYADTHACIVRLDGSPAGEPFDPGVGLARKRGPMFVGGGDP